MATIKGSQVAASSKASFTDGELEQLVEYVFGHRKLPIQGFLEEHGLAKTGKKGDLKERVQNALRDGTISAEKLVALLDHIEGWGNQHIYLYRSPPGEQKAWKKEAMAKKRLKDAGAAKLFNRKRPLVLPEEPMLSSVEWSKDHVRFVWVEKREWEMRLSDKDVEEDGILYKAY